MYMCIYIYIYVYVVLYDSIVYDTLLHGIICVCILYIDI